jgi:precorrin isomerase
MAAADGNWEKNIVVLGEAPGFILTLIHLLRKWVVRIIVSENSFLKSLIL